MRAFYGGVPCNSYKTTEYGQLNRRLLCRASRSFLSFSYANLDKLAELSEREKHMILLYCGVNEQQWNHHPVVPGKLACVAPVYGKTVQGKKCNRVKVPLDTEVIQDSGAFSG
jgi:hypothetical protein